MIYVTGDIHADRTRLDKKNLKPLKKGDYLLVCGDFGFIWNGDSSERKYLEKLSKRPYTICFIDGVHENFELLSHYPMCDRFGGKVRQIEPNIFYLPRGQIYLFNDKTVFAMGGGEDPNAQLTDDEFSESKHPEIPTKTEMLTAVENLERISYSPDYIITHEPPSKVRDFMLMSDTATSGPTALRAFFDELTTEAKYTRWFFGSMHTDKHISSSMTAVFKAVINAETGERI
jgi:hypothetical protein